MCIKAKAGHVRDSMFVVLTRLCHNTIASIAFLTVSGNGIETSGPKLTIHDGSISMQNGTHMDGDTCKHMHQHST